MKNGTTAFSIMIKLVCLSSILISCASVVPITFGDTKEGAFGVRVIPTPRQDRAWSDN